MSWIDRRWWLESGVSDRVYVGVPGVSNDKYDHGNKGLR